MLRSSVVVPEAASGVVEDFPLRWTKWGAAAQRDQDLLRQLG